MVDLVFLLNKNSQFFLYVNAPLPRDKWMKKWNEKIQMCCEGCFIMGLGVKLFKYTSDIIDGVYVFYQPPCGLIFGRCLSHDIRVSLLWRLNFISSKPLWPEPLWCSSDEDRQQQLEPLFKSTVGWFYLNLPSESFNRSMSWCARIALKQIEVFQN